MLFTKKHSLLSKKPIHIVRNALKSETDNLKVTELSEAKLHGMMKNKYGSGYHIISDINLTSNSPYSTTIDIKNEFDLFTNLFLIAVFIILWGLLSYKLIHEKSVSIFEIILMSTFPIIGTLITKFSFRTCDKRVMKLYNSLLNNDKPT